MQFLWGTVFAELFGKIVSFFINRGLAKFAIYLTWVSLALGLYTALIAALYAILGLFTVTAPDTIGFILSALPPDTPAFASAFFTVMIAKRAHDFKQQVLRDVNTAQIGASNIFSSAPIFSRK